MDGRGSAKAEERSLAGSVKQPKNNTQESDGPESSAAEDGDTDAGGADGGGYQGNDLAYKAVEIDEGLLSEELTYLRGLVWKILETVHSHYDFGLVYLDCTRFKERIVGHVRSLIKHIERHLQSEFLTSQRNI